MAVSERTYTFRGPSDLGERIREASQLLAELAAEPDNRLTEKFAREVGSSIARRGGVAGTGLTGDNQSAFLREMVELVVGAAQKVANDAAWAKAYAAEFVSTEEELGFRHAATRRAGERWETRDR
jgi:uncharacterized FlgJ-related protein